MRYRNIERKINRKQYFEDICMLYTECDSFEEFKFIVLVGFNCKLFLFGWFTIEALLNSLICLMGFCLIFHYCIGDKMRTIEISEKYKY